MNTVYQDIHDCCGCALCEYICPKNAITITQIDGFYYPHINTSLCVDCGLCKKNCAFIAKRERTTNCIEAYAVKHYDEAVIEKSSSGGVFTAISDYILKNDGIIVGADYDKNMNVIHTIATTAYERNRMRGSKYIQSNLSGIYCLIKDFLDQGQPVLFSGTPCQTESIKKAFGEYDNLFLIDIICHGVPNPAVWKDFVCYLEKKYNKKLIHYSFRDKTTSGWRSYSAKATFEDSTIITNSDIAGAFIELFRYDVCLRPSCTKCPYTSLNRTGDITIGDFWGIENVIPKISDNKGVSAVMLNSPKGLDLFNKVKNNLNIFKTTPDNIAKSQPNLSKPSQNSTKATQFNIDYKNMPFIKVLKKYTRIGFTRRVIDFIKNFAGK